MNSNNIPSSQWQIDDAGPEYIPQIRDLFKAAFKEEMSIGLWHWKYDDGRGTGVIVRRGDEVVAYFGGTERRVVFKGEALCAIQCGDSMVAEANRGTLSKKGPFYLSVTAFLGKYVGFNRPYLLSYGFPNARAMQLAEYLGVYAEVGNLVDVTWSAQSSSAFNSVEFDFESPEHQHILNQLWLEMAAEFVERTIGVRDLEYLRHRYCDHPELNYKLHLVDRKDNGGLLGLLVTRQVKDRLLLVDVVSATHTIRDLADFGRHLAHEQNCHELYGWLTEIDCHLVASASLEIGETPLRLPLGVYCEGLKAEEIKDTWFFMCGDSDFL